MAEFKTEGQISEFDFRKMVENISLFDMTGVLEIRPININVVYSFIFINGAIQMVTDNTTNMSKMIGTILLKNGKLTKQQLHTTLQEQERSHLFFGEVTEKNQFVSRADITVMLQRQLEDVLVSVAAVQLGTFSFATAELERRPSEVPIGISNNELINRFSLIQRTWAEIKDDLPPLKSFIARDDALLAITQPSEIEKEILGQLSQPLPFNIFLDANIHRGKLLMLKLIVSLLQRHFIKVISENEVHESVKATVKDSQGISDQIQTTIDTTKDILTVKHTRFGNVLAELFALIVAVLLFSIIFMSPLPQLLQFTVQENLKIIKPEIAEKTAYNKTIEALKLAVYCDSIMLSKVQFRDGWGTLLKEVGDTILSAGPDKTFDTDDDLYIQK